MSTPQLGTAVILFVLFVICPAIGIFLTQGNVQPPWMIEHNIPFKRIAIATMVIALIIGSISGATIIGLVFAIVVGLIMDAVLIFLMIVWLLIAAASVIRNLSNLKTTRG